MRRNALMVAGQKLTFPRQKPPGWACPGGTTA
jgi:hypothetical protein